MSNKRLIHGFHAINARLWQNPKSLLEIWLAGGRHDERAKAVLEKAGEENIKLHIVDKARQHERQCPPSGRGGDD